MPIKIDKIAKNFNSKEGELEVLKDISFEVKPGEFVCVVGSSGCGKSTLLQILADLKKPDSGRILNSPDKIGFVFQNFALFPWLNVKSNIEFGLKMNGKSKQQIDKISRREIERVGLGGFEKTHPKELSGGMKQRVGIARALAIEPQLLLLDEPLSALDEMTAKALRQDILRIWKETSTTIVMITHLVEEAVLLADKIVVLSPRPGRIRKVIENPLPRPRKVRDHKFYHMVDQIEELL